MPLPLTQGYLPALRFAEVNHHWPEMLLAQLATLYFLGLYETRAVLAPRPHLGAVVAAAGLQALLLIAVYFFRQDLLFPRSIFVVFAVPERRAPGRLAARLLGAARRAIRAGVCWWSAPMPPPRR